MTEILPRDMMYSPVTLTRVFLRINVMENYTPVISGIQQRTDNEIPIALILFGDKSHTDLHGSLSVTPIICTLSLFNRSARNNKDFWWLLAYIPNLSYGKNKAYKKDTKDKMQDEHQCLSVAFESIKDIHRSGGIYATVMGRAVKVKV